MTCARGRSTRVGEARERGVRRSTARPARSTSARRRRLRQARLRGRRYVMSARRSRPSGTQDVLWGGAGRRASSRPWPPTTAPSTSRGRRRWAGATSARSPTACPASSTRLSLIYTRVCVEGRIDLNQFVDLISTRAGQALRPLPAQGRHHGGRGRRPRGLGPRAQASTISAKTHAHARWTTASSRASRSTGWPATVVVDGRVQLIVDGETFLGNAGRGPLPRSVR